MASKNVLTLHSFWSHFRVRGKFLEERSLDLVQNASSNSIFTSAKMEGLTIWYEVSYISANICSPTIFLLMQTIIMNAFREKIYNVIFVVHFLITSILHKLDIRVSLGKPKSSHS